MIVLSIRAGVSWRYVRRMSKRFLVLVLTLLLAVAHLSTAFAASTDSSINITSPHNGDSVLQSNIQISGTAPPSILVNVIITDTDTSRALVAHQSNGRVEGSVTSDDGGAWVYTPQQQLVPGEFSVQASYTNAQKQTINSPSIKFVVITATGASEILSNDTRRSFAAAAVIVTILVIAFGVHLAHRHRHRNDEPEEESSNDRPRRRLKNEDEEAKEEPKEDDQKDKKLAEDSSSPMFLRTFRGRQYRAQEEVKLKALREETEKIENQLGTAAEQLEEANQEVVKLEEKIGHSPNPLAEDVDKEPKTEDKK